MTQFDALHEFVKACDSSFEEMKHDEGLCKVAEKTFECRIHDLEFRREFYSTIHTHVTEYFKNNRELIKFYDTCRDVCVEKFKEYSFKFLKHIEDKR